MKISKKWCIYILGLLAYAFGASMIARAEIGVSPVISVAYVFMVITPLSLGTTTFLLNIVLVLIQAVLMGPLFDKKQYLQIPISILFSVFVDLAMFVIDPFIPTTLYGRIFLFTLATLVMAIGVSFVIMANVMVLPADGLAKTIAYKLNLDFGKAKIINDTSMLLVTFLVSIIAAGKIIGIHVGTVISAFLLGALAQAMIKFFKPILADDA